MVPASSYVWGWRGSSPRSLTLIEILVALSILSTILIPMAVFIGFSFEGNLDQEKRMHAINLAQEKINFLLEKPFARIPVGIFSDKLLVDKNSGEVLVDLRPHAARNTMFHLQMETRHEPLAWLSPPAPGEEEPRQREFPASFLKIHLMVHWDDQKNFSLVGFKADI